MHINAAALPQGLLAGDAFETHEPSLMEPHSPCRENPKASQTSWLFAVHEQLHLEDASALTPPKANSNIALRSKVIKPPASPNTAHLFHMAADHVPAVAWVSFFCLGAVAVCCNTSEIKTSLHNP